MAIDVRRGNRIIFLLLVLTEAEIECDAACSPSMLSKSTVLPIYSIICFDLVSPIPVPSIFPHFLT